MNKFILDKKKKYLVLGFGISGKACANFMLSMGYLVGVADSRNDDTILKSILESSLSYSLVGKHLGSFSYSALSEYDAIIISPGIDLRHPDLVKFAIDKPIVSDIEVFAHFLAGRSKVIAITGSNGKSTVSTLMHECVLASGYSSVLAGNIGISPFENLDLNNLSDVYVLELSSFQLQSINYLECHAGLVLNISEDHLDRHGSLKEYAETKYKVYNFSRHAVINLDDKFSYPKKINNIVESVISFGSSVGDFHLKYKSNNSIALCYKDRELILSDSLKVFGEHNLKNVLAVLSLSYCLELPFKRIIPTICGFKGLEHRCQYVAEIDGITWINDSKGTNVGATLSALNGLSIGKSDKKIVLLLGGISKGADLSPLLDLVLKVRAVVCFGEAKQTINSLFTKFVPVKEVNSMEEACLAAKSFAIAGDTVLLSPACASFDMFANFKHRGETFSNAVKLVNKNYASTQV